MPKKPNRFVKIDVIKRYIFCSSYDDLFAYGEDGMTQVDFIDYGLGWEKLKTGQKGDTAMFEIVDFCAMCPDDQVAFNKRWEAQDKREKLENEAKKAQAKMRNRIKRLIVNNHYRKLYWLPTYTHGRLLLLFGSAYGFSALESLEAKMGAYCLSLAVSHCLCAFFRV